ncbi:MAG: molecular chaperone TorD family protein [Planctomycetes bacterium]|nr:molecular chaperone TorD family protein [Planctomycetota bacterium]
MAESQTHPAPVLDGETLACRAQVYRYLADALRYPGPDSEELAKWPPTVEEVEAHAGLEPARRAELSDALRQAQEAAQALEPGGLDRDYLAVFGHTIPKEYPPYETEFTADEVFRQTQELGDISGFYSAFGVKVSSAAADRVDAVHLELEFLYFLCVKEAMARGEGLAEQAETCRAAQARFLSDHLGRWGPSFGTRMAERSASPFYAALGRLLAAWLHADFALLGIPEPLPAGAPVAAPCPPPGEQACGADAEFGDLSEL